MGGLVTSGLGGQLVTVGLGGEEAVIIIQEVDDEKGGGIHGEGVYHKRRVQGIHADQWNKIQILRTVTSTSEIPINVLIPISIEKDLRMKIIEQVRKWADKSASIKVSIINISNDKSVKIKETYISKSEKQVNIIAGRLVSLIDKAVKILEREKKHSETQVNPIYKVLDDIEKAEILKLLDELGELDDLDR